MIDPPNRRVFLAGFGLMLTGCAAPPGAPPLLAPLLGDGMDYAALYGELPDEQATIPALDLSTIDADLLRRRVPYAGPARPGAIVVNIGERRLYHILPGGAAMRYAVGVGREEALNFRGAAVIGRKAAWPRWTPTETMIERIPKYAAYAGGMSGGIDNPLGARALYLYRGERDSHFRLHGTNEPTTIGTAVSSGCIRLFNHDIIDLYDRVPLGAPVVVLQPGEGPGRAREVAADRT